MFTIIYFSYKDSGCTQCACVRSRRTTTSSMMVVINDTIEEEEWQDLEV